MILPLLVVATTIIWTEALFVLSGIKLSMVSSMLKSLVTIIGVATLTHVTVHFIEQRKAHPPLESAKQTISELLQPIFWTCATTAVGFAALVSSHITPVYSFGIMMAIGSLIVFLSCMMILPGGILLGKVHIDPKVPFGEKTLLRGLEIINRGTDFYRRWLLISLLFIVSISTVGLFRLKVETDFSKNFRETSPLVQSLNFIETRLGGVGTWELNFPAPAELNEEYLQALRLLAEELRELKWPANEEGISADNPPLTKVVALTDGLDLVPRMIRKTLNAGLISLRAKQPEFVSSLYNPEQQRMRIVLRHERGNLPKESSG